MDGGKQALFCLANGRGGEVDAPGNRQKEGLQNGENCDTVTT
jgi:hypothetical protein